MSATLVIRDGAPHWWASPDIWVVPGDDPNGAPGQPIAGESAFLWARVRNTGDTAAAGGRIDFYWSNPATGVLRSNSTFVGSAFVDLEPGEVKEVLSVIPWIPTIVNEGHECVVAEVIHAADPLPAPPPDAFDPPTYHQIAQKNLTVLVMLKSMVRAIQISAPPRIKKRVRVGVEVGGAIDKQSLEQLGLGGYRVAKKHGVKAVLSAESGCDGNGGKDAIDLALEPGAIKAVYLRIDGRELEPHTYVPIHVVSRDEKRIEGGITYIAVAAEEE